MQPNVAGTTTHIIVVGNEKGGSGKSTTSMHVAVALLQDGLRVAVLDLDDRQRSLSRYVLSRQKWARAAGHVLLIPEIRVIERANSDSLRRNTWTEFETFAKTIAELEARFDVIVIDTPGSDTPLSRMAHSAADTLLTPLNDSLVDLDVLASIDGSTGSVLRLSHYAQMVAEARRERYAVDGRSTDWIVIRTRLSQLASRNRKVIDTALANLSAMASFRVGPGISERVIFRELFGLGLTALDPLEVTGLGTKPSVSHVVARQEIRAVVDTLRLPVGDRAKRRQANRAAWNEAAAAPLDVGDILERR